MDNQTNVVSPEKDYILSCATLFSEIGFPKSAFIKMVGEEYASDIFELMYDGRLVMGANVFTYPQRDKRKKRINQVAKEKLYKAVYNELNQFLVSHLLSLGFDTTDVLPSLRPSSCKALENTVKNIQLREKARRYNVNLGRFLSETLIRCIDKMPLDACETQKVNTLLGWYFWVLDDFTRSDAAFNNQLREIPPRKKQQAPVDSD